MDTHVNERERVRKGYHGIARARTSKQAHLQRHIMRELGPVGPHYLVGGGGERQRNLDTIMKVFK